MNKRCQVCGDEIKLKSGRWRHKSWGLRLHKPIPAIEKKYFKSYADDGTPTGVADISGDPADGLVVAAATILNQATPWIHGRPEPEEPERLPSFSEFSAPRDTSGPSFIDTVMAQSLTTNSPIELEAPEPPSSSDSSSYDCGSSSDSSSCDCSSSDSSSSS